MATKNHNPINILAIVDTDFKAAVKMAAAKHNTDVSKFVRGVLAENEDVKKYLKTIKK